MTDREFKRLSRPQLIEIIYQLQLREEELSAENQKLKDQLEDKRIRLEQSGNIAEAVLGIHDVMQTAQDAAQLYVDEIHAMRDETREACDDQLRKTREECDKQLQQAKEEGAAIIGRAVKLLGIDASVLDLFLRECEEKTGDQT